MAIKVIEFGTNFIYADELLTVRLSKRATIREINTFNNINITQPATVTPRRVSLTSTFKLSTHDRIFAWMSAMDNITLASLIVGTINWGSHYVENVDAEFDKFNSALTTPIWANVNIDLVQNINFA